MVWGDEKCKIIHLFPAGIEPATLSVWRTRDNHYTKETVGESGKKNKTSSKLGCSGVDGLCTCGTSGLVAQRITRLTTDQKIAGSNPAEIDLFPYLYFLCLLREKLMKHIKWCKKRAPPGGLEPPTFRLTAERASRLRHRDILMFCSHLRLFS